MRPRDDADGCRYGREAAAQPSPAGCCTSIRTRSCRFKMAPPHEPVIALSLAASDRELHFSTFGLDRCDAPPDWDQPEAHVLGQSRIRSEHAIFDFFQVAASDLPAGQRPPEPTSTL